VLITAENIPAG